VVSLAAVVIVEVIAGLGEWLVMPASTCRGSLGNSAIVVVAFGVVMFSLTAAGTFWRRFIGRRMETLGQRRLEGLRTTNAPAARRVDSLVARFSWATRLTQSMWINPWLTALIAAGLLVAIFGALIVVGAALEPNSCGS